MSRFYQVTTNVTENRHNFECMKHEYHHYINKFCFSYLTFSHQHPKVRVESREPVKEIDYQVQMRIIEARQLSGMQLDPVCTVSIANQKKHTAVKEQTNTPFWDEFFVFDFKMPAPVLFDKIINFQVFTGRNLVSQGILIGSFKVD